jgi:squalene cyclase
MLKKNSKFEEETMKHIILPLSSLKNIVTELYKKNIELYRLTKTSTLLMMSGVTPNSIPQYVLDKCVREQHEDGGWVSVVDTAWNVKFLTLFDRAKFKEKIEKGLNFIISKRNMDGIWGRHKRDISRIPVTGLILFLLPELSSYDKLLTLEKLWLKEYLSITYKAAYILLAFNRVNYKPQDSNIIRQTVDWLVKQQREDGGFAPWKEHVIDSDVFCTSAALLGLLSYRDLVPSKVLKKGYDWLTKNQLASGLWKYHQIEDGSSWGVYALVELSKVLKYGQNSLDLSSAR